MVEDIQIGDNMVVKCQTSIDDYGFCCVIKVCIWLHKAS
jgi:hypothetical protein